MTAHLFPAPASKPVSPEVCVDAGFPDSGAGGGAHIPVLGGRIVEFLNVRAGGIYIDGTFGAGGYTEEILDAADCRVIAIDRDPTVHERAGSLADRFAGRLTLVEDRFSHLDVVATGRGVPAVDGVVLDVGVSSMQLDEAERGFSFRHDGPLDMRMGRSGPSAADLVAVASARDLATIIATLGEEKMARPIARAIVAARNEAPILTTKALAAVITGVVRQRFGEIHPATRTFQALRIFINDELGELAEALAAAERILRPEGRLVVVSFHSLEDRIVKTFIAERSRAGGGSRHMPEVAQVPVTFTVLTRRPVTADDAEVARNPRARSAKLRAAERTAAPPRAFDPADLLPSLPSLADVMRSR